MTIVEYIQAQSVGGNITELNIRGMLLNVSRVSDCLLDPENFDADDIDEEVDEVLTVKGMDILLAQYYYLLSSTTGDKQSVKMGNVTISNNMSYGVNDRLSFREMGDTIYADWGVIEETPSFYGLRSCDLL